MVKFVQRAVFTIIVLLTSQVSVGFADPSFWQNEWPNTDFSKSSIDFKEVLSGGPPKDGIPAIDTPEFQHVRDVTHLKPTEPVIGVVIDGLAKAYPLQVLIETVIT